MATRSVSRAGKARSSPSREAMAIARRVNALPKATQRELARAAGKAQSRPTKKNALTKVRKIPDDAAEKIRLELIDARAAALTAISGLRGGEGLTDAIAVCLLQHVVGPLENVLEMVP